MRQQIWLACVLATLLWAAPAKGDTGVIVSYDESSSASGALRPSHNLHGG